MTTKTKRDKRVEEKIRCDACPVMCYISDGKSGACDRYANVAGDLNRVDPLTIIEHTVASGGSVVPFLPEYVDMIFGGPLQMHAVLAVDPQSDFAAERDAFYGAAIANRGKVLHIIMFKPPDDDGDAE